jgi:Tol biopolymer transport system component
MLSESRFRVAIWLSIVVLAVVVAIAGVVSVRTLRIVASSPLDDDLNVPITAPIHLEFSERMDRESVESRFSLAPETPGRFEWQDSSLVFRPAGAFAPTTAYTLTLASGASSARGLVIEEPTVLHFTTRPPALLYLGLAEGKEKARQIHALHLDGLQAVPLTSHPLGVWDYAVHPLGDEVVYSVLRKDGGADLWRMDRDGSNARQLAACPEAACVGPAWSPDGRRLAYERRNIWAGEPNLDPQAARIWLLDLLELKAQPLFDYDVPLHTPRWSPDAQRLALVSPLLPGVEVRDLQSGETQQFGNEWGAPPAWSPAGDRLVAADMLLIDEAWLVRLVRTDLDTGEQWDVSGPDDFVRDTSPAWSPPGGWIAFSRQHLDEERWTPGRQIWLTRPDGSEAYEVVNQPMADLYAATWRPDGGAIAYLATDLSASPQPRPDVSVWVFDLTTRRSERVADNGVAPEWLP